VSSEVGFAKVAKKSPARSPARSPVGSVLLFFCFLLKSFLLHRSKSGGIFCYIKQSGDLGNLDDTCQQLHPGDRGI
jgi:hypothetical protein